MNELLSRDVVRLLALCVTYIFWAVVPLLPAVMIYRLFPNAPVDTQWKILGVAVKAGGAAGFYFAILALGFFKFLEPTIEYVRGLQRPYWTVEALVQFVESDDSVSRPYTTNSAEQIRIQPYAYDFKQTDDQTYLITMRFAELNSDTDSIRLIFPEGIGFIPLKQMMSSDNTNNFLKRVSLTKGPPTKIHPPVKWGQNAPSVSELSQKLERGLETISPR
ncbi:hypothetical protein ACVIWV_007751 [Bradyrhizobium diazoefficiens]|nr:hypothetical protein [Bradyrhizobium diazoefficiens]MBR0860768.1 hypothetical protein [Bradyrhizobium diazoefficiens]MBR0885259.1 hypothetical protein [Bradyrhizobium diazoefficiens]MBR0916854.1 hypothetical protein [Bradyrhizobium diazoefficiens]